MSKNRQIISFYLVLALAVIGLLDVLGWMLEKFAQLIH